MESDCNQDDWILEVSLLIQYQDEKFIEYFRSQRITWLNMTQLKSKTNQVKLTNFQNIPGIAKNIILKDDKPIVSLSLFTCVLTAWLL